MSVMGIVKDLLEEISKLKNDKLKQKFIDSLVSLPGAKYTNLNQAFQIIRQKSDKIIAELPNQSKSVSNEQPPVPAANQRPRTKKEASELPIREQLYNEEGVRIRDLINKPQKPKARPQAPPVPAANQRPRTKKEASELPIREQLYNEDGVRIRDLIGKPSIVDQAVLADTIKNRANEVIKSPEEEKIKLVNNTKLEIPEVIAPITNRGTQTLTSDDMRKLLQRVQDVKSKPNYNATFHINTEEDIGLRWREMQQAMNFNHDLFGRNLTPYELGMVGRLKPMTNTTTSEPMKIEQDDSWLVETLKATPNIIYKMVAEYGPQVWQWLKDHESKYDTPLPSITMLMDAQPEAEAEAEGEDLEPLPQVNRLTGLREQMMQRHGILRGIREGPGTVANIQDVDDIIETPTHAYEINYNEGE